MKRDKYAPLCDLKKKCHGALNLKKQKQKTKTRSHNYLAGREKNGGSERVG